MNNKYKFISKGFFELTDEIVVLNNSFNDSNVLELYIKEIEENKNNFNELTSLIERINHNFILKKENKKLLLDIIYKYLIKINDLNVD